jgi:1-deoxy-D-xylulose-5-phosphate reductoisomerase
MRNLTILGSTGSVGVNTLNVVAQHPGEYRVVALSARQDIDTLFKQCLTHKPRYAVMLEHGAARQLEKQVKGTGIATRVLSGMEALEEIASLPEVDTVMASIVGIAGLRPTLAAVRAGKKVLLANKESLVSAGALFMDAVKQHDAILLPIDSEHNAVFQALPRGHSGSLKSSGVRRILLTASGGPFRTMPYAEFEHVTPDEACAHPNWVMGRKISVDSATMMNKGLEVIEASWLFAAAPECIEVVVHPESIIHSLVEYVDGSVIAQLGNPDMRTPIAHALAYPDRIVSGVDYLDLTRIGSLRFEKPDMHRFPCLRLAFDALRASSGAATALNAANEVAVARFLASELRFTCIPTLIEDVVGHMGNATIACLDDVLAIDDEARRRAVAWSRVRGVSKRAEVANGAPQS